MKTAIQPSWFFSFVVVAAVLCTAFTPAEKSTTEFAPFDTTFVLRAASSSAMHKQLGEMAQSKASSPEVKALGAAIAKDHAALNSEIMSLAKTLNIAVPDTLVKRDQRHIEHLKSMSGAPFDRLYVRLMADAHSDEAADYEAAASKASIGTVKAFANKQLAMLKSHQTAAQNLRSKMKEPK